MEARAAFTELHRAMSEQVLGQERLVNRLMIALLADGHLLVEGPPGLAKTRAIKELSRHIEGDFHRVQFTPDLLPGDLTGTDIYRPETSAFQFQHGPIFHNLVLADEINRAPAKVQSALLEAMAEHQVSVGQRSYPLPRPFLVMATQNPIEQEGTYPLPEAQLDRFLLHVEVSWPDAETEKKIMKLVREEAGAPPAAAVTAPLTLAQLETAQQELRALHLAPAVEEYIVQLVQATRHAQALDAQLAGWIEWGASPRASLALEVCARAQAWLADRDYVSPEDVQDLAPDVLRHRILPSFAAQAEGISTTAIIDRLLHSVPVG